MKDPTLFIALGLHGDGVAYTKNMAVEVFSWNFLAVPFAERPVFGLIEKRFLCKLKEMKAAQTDAYWNVIRIVCNVSG